MNWLDIVILASVGVIALTGWRMGGIHIGITGVGILAGIALASHLHSEIRPLFDGFIDSDNWADLAAFAALFILVLVASAIVGFMVRAVLGGLRLGLVDNVMGLGLGIGVSFAIGSAVFSALQSYPVLGLEGAIEGSTLGSFLADNFDTVLRGLKFIPGDFGT